MRPVLLVALALASVVTAQRGPLPGIPLVQVNHPALAAQPLMQPDANKPKPAAPKPGKTTGQKRLKPKPIDPATAGKKFGGKQLKKRIERVTSLAWGKDLFGLRARSAATGKPIFYLQALGSLDGYA